MKSLLVGLVVLGLSINAASATFNTSHEFSGLRSLLASWQPNDSLAAFDAFSAIIASALDGIDTFNDTDVDEIVRKFEPFFSEKMNTAADEYNEDITNRWNVLTPRARDYLAQEYEIWKKIFVKVVELKLPRTVARYLLESEEDRISIKSSFPAIMGAFEKLSATWEEDE